MTTRVLYASTFLSGAGGNRSYCEDLSDRLEQTGASVIRTSTRTGRVARVADLLATAWRRRHDYDVAIVDVFSGFAFGWAEAVCFELRRLRKPYVLTLHGGELPSFAGRWPRRVRRLLASAAVVTAPSAYLQRELKRYRADIELVPNAIDATAFPPPTRQSARPRLIWVRAFHALYNPKLAIDVVARLQARFEDTTLVMLGPDKGDGELVATEELARARGVTDRVRFVGRVARDEVARYLRDADVFINTTDVDNTPLSLLEAAACGLCVVTTAVGGIPDLFEHERNALLVPARDPESMGNAIERVITSPDLAAQLSREAHALAIRHDWGPVLERWNRTLDQVSRV